MSVHPSSARVGRVPVLDTINESIPNTRRTTAYQSACQILLILVVLIFGILMIVIIARQESSTKTIIIREVFDEEKKRDEYEKVAYDDCIETIWENLLRFNSHPYNFELLQPIRIKVFATLHRLNSKYKSDLILFLYERELIRTDIPTDQRLNLRGADLKNIQFENLKLNYLYLPGVIATNSSFYKCQLEESNFQGSFMDKSHFTNCSLKESTFSGASLKESLFTNNVLTNIDLSNTDLLYSHIDTKNIKKIQNTRLPNESYSNIDSKELIKDGGAEEQCNLSKTNHWSPEHENSFLQITSTKNNSCFSTRPNSKNNCFFQAKSSGQLFQDIDLTRYSTLIDNNQARYNISVYMGCSNVSNSKDWTFMELRFANKRKNWENYPIIKNDKSVKLFQNNSLIPVETRTVRIIIRATILNSSKESHSCCAIDDVHFNIFKKN